LWSGGDGNRMKSKLGMVVGVVYVLMGVSVAVAPEWFLSVDWGSRQGLLTAAAMRAVVGVALLVAASASKYPMVFRVFGAIALIAGLTMPFVPLDDWAEYMRWWTVENPSMFRWVFATAATLFGAFIVYASLPRRAAR